MQSFMVERLIAPFDYDYAYEHEHDVIYDYIKRECVTFYTLFLILYR